MALFKDICKEWRWIKPKKDYKETIAEFVKKLDTDPYMSFVVSYFKNKEVAPELNYLDRGDLFENTDNCWVGAYGKDKDKEILQYCFDYSDKNTQTLTKTFKDYILDKDLVEFCMDKISRSTQEGANVRILQCTIPTFVLYNPNKYNFIIEYGKFESHTKYEALGKILIDFTGTTQLTLQAKCKSLIFVSPRVFLNNNDDMLNDFNTDTQYIEDGLKTLDSNGDLYAVFPADWLTKDEESKRRLISNNYLDTVLKLPAYKMHEGKDLIWLHFKTHRNHTDDIRVYEFSKMGYSNDTNVNTDSESLQKKMRECQIEYESIDQFMKRFDEDNKRKTIERLYGEYVKIIDSRVEKSTAIAIKNIVINNILKPLHFTCNELNKDYYIELGKNLRNILLGRFLLSFVHNKVIDSEIYATLINADNRLLYLSKQKEKLPPKFQNITSFTDEIPKFVVNTLFDIKNLGNYATHYGEKEESANPKESNEYPERDKIIGELKNSIISCCFNFLDVLKWYDAFLAEKEKQHKKKQFLKESTDSENMEEKDCGNIEPESCQEMW